jgi:hypothetical protein
VQIPGGLADARVEIHALPDTLIEGDESIRVFVDIPDTNLNAILPYAYVTNQFAEITIKDAVAITNTPFILIQSFSGTPAGVILHITGPSGKPAVLENSLDLKTWTDMQSIIIPDGNIDLLVKSNPPSSQQFFRFRTQ